MKSARFLWAAIVVFLAGVCVLFSSFNGNLNLGAGWPLSQFAFKISGEAHGIVVLIAFVAVVAALVLLVLALVHQIRLTRN